MTIPLFKRYVEYIEPPHAIMIGSPNQLPPTDYSFRKRIDHLAEGRKKSAFAHTGLLFKKFKLVSLPHPQAQIATESRKFLWKETKKFIDEPLNV